jgi:hypothetical protein
MAHCRAAERHRQDGDGRAKKRLQKQEHRKASVRAKVEHPFRVMAV